MFVEARLFILTHPVTHPENLYNIYITFKYELENFWKVEMGHGGEKCISLCILCNHVKKSKYKLLQKVLNFKYSYAPSKALSVSQGTTFLLRS